MKKCRDCGRDITVTEISAMCHWCHDMRLLAGGWEPPRLSERWTEAELVELRKLAASLCSELLAEASLRKEARRRAKTEKERREDGQVTFV